MRLRTGGFLLILGLALPALAEAPVDSLRPMPRPDAPVVTAAPADPEPVATAAHGTAAPASTPRPMPRPGTAAAPSPQPVATVAQAGLVAAPRPLTGLFSRLRPAPRPETRPETEAPAEVEPAAAVRIQPGRTQVFGRKGSVCGVNGIKGETLAPITSRVRGCGIEDPVRVTSVDGVQLSMAATLDCPTARALHDWVRNSLQPAFGRGKVAQLQVAAHYACRPRNNVRGAPVSEHGRGKAIDISAIVLTNGTTVSVLDDWRNRAGRPMVKAYRAACGTFGTTLGPDSDRFHRNHMHFDTARHRNGAYCR
jgi:hypothetical protein